MPATEIDFEREFAELVAQLRDVPAGAPEPLRARVRALGEPKGAPTLRARLATPRWRRAALVAAPACVAVLLSVAIVRGLLSSSSPRPEAATTVSNRALPSRGGSGRGHVPVFGANLTNAQRGVAGAGTGGRPVDYDASLRIRVRDLDTLSDRTAEAMQITRSLGGYVDSVQQSTTRGRPGEADLVLRVPVARVETALIRLSKLG